MRQTRPFSRFEGRVEIAFVLLLISHFRVFVMSFNRLICARKLLKTQCINSLKVFANFKIAVLHENRVFASSEAPRSIS